MIILPNQTLFPKNEVARLFSQLSAWTSVEDICRAARMLENRLAIDEDGPQETIVAGISDHPIFESLYHICLRYLAVSYRCPGPKLLLAMYKDKNITPATRQSLRSGRAMPQLMFCTDKEIKGLRKLPPGKYVVLRDAPHMIELIYRPFHALRSMVNQFGEAATHILSIKREADETSDRQPILIHQPHCDSALIALIEAIAYHLAGAQIVPFGSTNHQIDIGGYRNIVISGHPPFDPKLVKIAQGAQSEQFEELRHE